MPLGDLDFLECGGSSRGVCVSGSYSGNLKYIIDVQNHEYNQRRGTVKQTRAEW